MSLFEAAVHHVKHAFQEHDILPTDQQKLSLYALYKQSTIGDCTISQPSVFSPIERAKWAAWNQIKGTDCIVAKQKYVELVTELDTSFQTHNLPEQPMSNPLLPPPSTTQNTSYHVEMQQYPIHQTSWETMKEFFKLLLILCGIGCVYTAILKNDTLIQTMLPRFIQQHVLEPLLWFLAGIILSRLVRSHLLQWKVITLFRPILKPLHTKPMSQKSIKKHRQLASKLSAVGVQIQPATETEPAKPILAFELRDDATKLDKLEASLAYSFDQVVDAYLKKFKMPLPDPAQPELEDIQIEFEKHFTKWKCTVIKRLLKIRNTAPYFVRRLAKQDHVFFIEEMLIDHRNKILTIRGHNRSFSHFGTLKTYSRYEAHRTKPNHTKFIQFGEVKLHESLGLARGTIERFLKRSYQTGSKQSMRHMKQRLLELYGSPEEAKEIQN